MHRHMASVLLQGLPGVLRLDHNRLVISFEADIRYHHGEPTVSGASYTAPSPPDRPTMNPVGGVLSSVEIPDERLEYCRHRRLITREITESILPSGFVGEK